MQRDHVRQRSRWYGTSFSPLSLFFGGANGAWYDPSDFSTMFQDAAGTTPVTAVGQPVGLILDKSGRGNHAFNPSGNSANFPALSARYNLLTKTEQFDDASVWFASGAPGASVTPNTETAPNGTLTADTISNSPGSSYSAIYQAYVTSGGQLTASIYVKANTANSCVLLLRDNTAAINLQSSASIVSGPGSVSGTTLITVSNLSTTEWTLVKLATVSTTTSGNQIRFLIYPELAIGTGKSVYIWGADLRVANDALNQPAYQRVNTATDYDTPGFKPYLSFNGVNQWLKTNSIDFTAADKMFVSAGVRKLSDAALGTVVGLTTGIASNNGAFRLAAPGSAAPNLAWSAKGTTQVDLTSTTYTAPTTSIVSGTADISGPSTIQRINGAQTASSASSLGTGNFSNAALYLGASGGTANWLNGRLYGLVVAGKQASASEIASTESWLNQKTGAY